MAIRKKATRRTKAKRKKTTVTKTATSRKTKTVRNKRAMKGSPLLAPQLITGARMLYLVWIPEDPSAVAALVPKELKPEARRSVLNAEQNVLFQPELLMRVADAADGLDGRFDFVLNVR